MTTPTREERRADAERALLAAIEAARPNQLTEERAREIREAEQRLLAIERGTGWR